MGPINNRALRLTPRRQAGKRIRMRGKAQCYERRFAYCSRTPQRICNFQRLQESAAGSWGLEALKELATP